jgi:hypothetical protein
VRRTWIIAATLITVIAGTALWQITHRPARTQQAATVTATPPRPTDKPITSPATSSPRPPIGNESEPSTTSDPVRAAVRFLELDEQLFPTVTPERARALSDSITSTAARKRLGDRAEEHQRATLAKGDLAGLVLRIAPISTRVRNVTDASATVDVFFLRLWSFPGKGALDDYATAQIDVVFEDGVWRLSDSSVIDGPYPVARFSARPVIASTATRFEQLLAGFDDTGLVP